MMPLSWLIEEVENIEALDLECHEVIEVDGKEVDMEEVKEVEWEEVKEVKEAHEVMKNYWRVI